MSALAPRRPAGFFVVGCILAFWCYVRLRVFLEMSPDALDSASALGRFLDACGWAALVASTGALFLGRRWAPWTLAAWAVLGVLGAFHRAAFHPEPGVTLESHLLPQIFPFIFLFYVWMELRLPATAPGARLPRP